jgi:hypothetical protein
MSNYDREQREMDAVQNDLRLGLSLQVIGWTLLAFDGIIVVFVWTGLRAGSYFWLYWTVIEGVLGLALTMVGKSYKARAGTEVSRLSSDVGDGTKAA